MANTKVVVPTIGNVFADRDSRKSGRRVKVVKLVSRERKAVCENVKTKKQTRIGYDTLASRFSKVGR